jgi:hypothetical protein
VWPIDTRKVAGSGPGICRYDANVSKQSVNREIPDAIVAEADGPDVRRRRLERYVTWDAEEAAAFDHVLAQMRVGDEDAWRVTEPVRDPRTGSRSSRLR